MDCSAGKAQPLKGKTSCNDCHTGKYQNVGGKTQCKNCLPGQVMAATTGAQTSCDACAKGKVMGDVGQQTCIDCNNGKYMPTQGQSACIDCLPGTVRAATSGPTQACDNCVAGKIMESPGAHHACIDLFEILICLKSLVLTFLFQLFILQVKLFARSATTERTKALPVKLLVFHVYPVRFPGTLVL